jgi:hypothetical protein
MLLGPQRGQRGLDEVVIAHRHASRGDQEIAAEPPAQARLDLVLPVAGHAEIDGLCARRPPAP